MPEIYKIQSPYNIEQKEVQTVVAFAGSLPAYGLE